MAILYDVAPAERQKELSQHNPTTPFGPAIFYPQIADMPNYHNNALWPFVGSYWALAQAKAGNEAGVVEGIGSIFRPAALFATNKENFNLDNGDIYTELNSSNMLWSLAGNIALTQRILFGIQFEKEGLRIAPFVPKAFAADRTLENFPYRGARLDISVKGYGDKVKSLILNGKTLDPTAVIPAKALAKGGKIEVVMDNEPIEHMALNRVPNAKAPLTPITWFETEGNRTILNWNPIEYIGEYVVLRDGKAVASTHETRFDATKPGEWQVIGIAGDGTQSFASEPRSNRWREFFQFPGETKQPVSGEISYRPKAGKVKGFTGNGFAETDRTTDSRKVTLKLPEGGVYSVAVRYANGNGPVNTENKAAIRTLKVDGNKAGTLVMPTRGVGNWDDWGMSNGVLVKMAPGEHEVSIEYLPEDENMNINTNHALLDRVEVVKVEDKVLR